MCPCTGRDIERGMALHTRAALYLIFVPQSFRKCARCDHQFGCFCCFFFQACIAFPVFRWVRWCIIYSRRMYRRCCLLHRERGRQRRLSGLRDANEGGIWRHGDIASKRYLWDIKTDTAVEYNIVAMDSRRFAGHRRFQNRATDADNFISSASSLQMEYSVVHFKMKENANQAQPWHRSALAFRCVHKITCFLLQVTGLRPEGIVFSPWIRVSTQVDSRIFWA